MNSVSIQCGSKKSSPSCSGFNTNLFIRKALTTVWPTRCLATLTLHRLSLYLRRALSGLRRLLLLRPRYPTASDLVTKLSVNPDSVPNFSFRHGVHRYKNRIWLGIHKAVQLKVMEALHSSPTGVFGYGELTLAQNKNFYPINQELSETTVRPRNYH